MKQVWQCSVIFPLSPSIWRPWSFFSGTPAYTWNCMAPLSFCWFTFLCSFFFPFFLFLSPLSFLFLSSPFFSSFLSPSLSFPFLFFFGTPFVTPGGPSPKPPPQDTPLGMVAHAKQNHWSRGVRYVKVKLVCTAWIFVIMCTPKLTAK